MDYVDASTQTVWAGLMQRTVRPETLCAAPRDTSTPPAEMADMVTDKSQFAHNVPEIIHSHHGDHDQQSKPTLIERRQGRPGLVARISLPNSELNDEVPLSPPPTHAVLSPHPEANTRHAGHTPLIPRARSPSEPEGHPQGPSSSMPHGNKAIKDVISLEDDEALSGSLVLPTDPEAADDDPVFISLNKLDQELGKIARQQRHLRGEFSDDEDEAEKEVEQESLQEQAGPTHAPGQSENQPPQSPSERMRELPGSLNPYSGPLLTSAPVSPPQAPSQSPPSVPVLSLAEQIQPVATQNNEGELPLSRKGSADSTKSTATDDVDGVRLKTPPSNFGAPFGHL